MSAFSLFAQLETTIGVLGLMAAIVLLVLAIGVFVVIQIAEEHVENVKPRPDIRHH